MLEKYVNIGDKVEIRPLHRASLKNEETQEQKVYFSRVNQILKEDKLEILMPMEQARVVLLPRNIALNLIIYTSNGLYQCEVKASERYKNGNVLLQALDILSGLKRYQRREFYRYACTVPVLYRSLTDEEKENKVWDNEIPYITGSSFDIGGGGVRFRADQPFEVNETILCVLHLEVKGNLRDIQTLSKVLSTTKIKNSDAYEVRVQYEQISNRDRELIIQYIFEDERRRRRQESGL